MSPEKIVKKSLETKEKLLYYLASALLPNIFLFSLYNGNRDDTHLVFGHVFILAGILVVVGVIGLLINRLLVGNDESAILVLLIFWSLFWLFEAIYDRTGVGSKNLLLAMVVAIVIGSVISLRFIGKNFYKGRIVFNMVAGVICLMFLFNGVPAVVANVGTDFETTTEQGEFLIRRTFNVDETLPSPDIYWLHMDGMINFTDMAYFFDDPQEELREALVTRGFVINEDARFVAHDTVFGVPGLLSPDFYDSYLGELLATTGQSLRRERAQALRGTFAADHISLADDVAPYHELFHAFMQAGYTAAMIADFDERVYVPLGQFYRLGHAYRTDGQPLTLESVFEVERHGLRDALDLIELLAITTPIPYRFVFQIREGIYEWEQIPTLVDEIDQLTAHTLDTHHERQLYRRLIDSFSVEEPMIMYMTLMFTHANRWQWYVEELVGHGDHAHRIDLYPEAHQYAANVMLTMIDMILAENPDAVIVLQADHGFHLHRTQRQLLADGLTEAQVADLQNSVMNAVRIPQQYGGLDAPLDPRNITRELVNRFVGDNYELLVE